MTVWERIWFVWALSLAVHVVFFLVVEGLALMRAGFGDTLTESVVALRDGGSWVYWLIVDIVTLTGITMGWLVWHFRYWVRVP